MRLERVDSPAAWPSSWRAVMAGWVNQLGEPVVPQLAPGQSLRVLVDAAQDRPLACARIVPPLPSDTLPPAQASAASDALRFHFRVGKLVHVSDELPLYNPQQILLMGNDLCDAVEITDLAVDPQAQVKVDLPTGKVEVQSGQDHGAIARAIEEEGYKVAA